MPLRNMVLMYTNTKVPLVKVKPLKMLLLLRWVILLLMTHLVKQNKKRADVLDQETKKHGGIPEQGKENNAVDDIDVLLSEA